jgi:hypothetical protein
VKAGVMSDAPRIVLRPNPNITTEQARDARANAWRFAFECLNRRAEQEGGPPTAPDSAKGGSSDSSAKTILYQDL